VHKQNGTASGIIDVLKKSHIELSANKVMLIRDNEFEIIE